MNFCVNCLHFRAEFCCRPTGRLDHVTGQMVMTSEFAAGERSEPWPWYLLTGSCGREGRFFLAKAEGR